MNIKTLNVECGTCNGTGVYKDTKLKEGEGIVCLDCEGKGSRTVAYVPFTQRKQRTDIGVVFRSRRPDGKYGVYPNPVTYAEFLAGMMPEISSSN